MSPGTKYIVVDSGGGTVDISCHRFGHLGIKEIVPPSGGDWGSSYVNENFVKFLEDVFGSVVNFAELKKIPEWLSIIDDFEVKFFGYF